MRIAELVVGWALLGVVALGFATRVPGVRRLTAVAVLHDGLPLQLWGAWLALLIGVVQASWLLIVPAFVFVSVHVVVIVRARQKAPRPDWVRSAPRLRVVVSNVYVDNRTPEALARVVVAAGADVAVVVEHNERFTAAMEAAGASAWFEHRVEDPSDDSAYAVALWSRRPIVDSGVEKLHEVSAVYATVMVGERPLTIAGLNLWAPADPGGAPRWAREMDVLVPWLRDVPQPFVVAGDFNSTAYRPDFRRLFALGLRDVHEMLGHGLRPSFKLSARGLLSAVGPLIRLDHALVTDDVFPLEAHELPAGGSDHIPFVVTLAVRSA